MIRIRDIKLPVGCTGEDIYNEIIKVLCLDRLYPGNSYPEISFEIVRKSIDARQKPDIFYVYTVELVSDKKTENEITQHIKKCPKLKSKRIRDRIITAKPTLFKIPVSGDIPLKTRPVVIGSGPAGLFCALILARAGFCPLVLERGEEADKRKETVEKFWKTGELDSESNVSFGEGGAGTFSDGKLNTLTKDEKGRNTFVIRTFAQHGAPSSIVYDAKPHIGTDILLKVVKSIRNEITSLGGSFCFSTKVTDILHDGKNITGVKTVDVKSRNESVINVDVCVLCPGHSARDTFKMLFARGINMSQKSFAAGFRIIHPQENVDIWQYGKMRSDLPPADYKVTNTTDDGHRVYSFCMCPGGYVVNASSEQGRTCVNGMSESKRDGMFANSAIIAAVGPKDFKQDDVPSDHPLAGMYYQQNLEEMAYNRGKGAVPVQAFSDFEKKKSTEDAGVFSGAFKGSIKCTDLSGIFSEDIDKAIIESVRKFGYTMKGFEKGLLAGIEDRTSSPVRILRDETGESEIKGLYPCGEGAGYAGGITSAASDGIECACNIIKKYRYCGTEE